MEYSKLPLTKLGLMPKEETLEISKRNIKMTIGIPKEITFQENRIPLAPQAVNLLTNNGHQIIIESNAGKAANFSDNEYSDAGARIVYSAKDAYEANLIVKIAPPTINEIAYLKQNQTIISALQLNIQKKEYFQLLMNKSVSALAFEKIQEGDSNIYPIVRSMSEIAGNTSILIAAEYLSNIHNGKGQMMGGVAGVTPTEIVIIGAGTVGEFAARSAISLGATVKVFDESLEKLRRLQNNIGKRIFTSIVQPLVLAKALKTADVVIGAIHSPGKCTPCVVTETMVENMKKGSVIIDVSIDKGGCCETSKLTNHSNPVFEKHGVIHYCVPNINSRVSRTATYALSNILTPILLEIGDNGGLQETIKHNFGLRKGLYLYNGLITNDYIASLFDLPYKDIDLLSAAL